ncbi:glycosyltransferase family 4 protein [Phocaeicola sp.]
MKILYDYQAFTFQYFGGVSKSFCELISHLSNDIQTEIGVVQSNNIHLIQSGICKEVHPVSMDWITFNHVCRFRGKGHLYSMLNRLFPHWTAENVNRRRTIELLKEGKYNIFHPTFFDDYFLPYLNNKPFVLTVHDMMPELFPKYFKKNDPQIVNKRLLAKKASAIVAVSENTKNDLVNILEVPKDKVTVIYHGAPSRRQITSEPLVGKPYFLYMGTRTNYKNFSQTIVDFAGFTRVHADVLLICTGSNFNKTELALIRKYKVADKVMHRFATDKDVENLYAYAVAFIYPSLYEGFGMPILEAFAYGCPVLLNHKSCFPEIAGDAGVFFTSDDYGSDLYQKMEMVWNWCVSERRGVIEKGYKRLECFSWNESSKKLYEVYNSILL